MKEENTAQEMSHEIDNQVSQEQNQTDIDKRRKTVNADPDFFATETSENLKKQVGQLSNHFLSSDNNQSLNGIDDCFSDYQVTPLMSNYTTDPEFLKMMERLPPETYEQLAKRICEEKDDDLQIKDSVCEAIEDLKENGIEMEIELDEKCKFKAKDHVFKNSNVVYENGIPKVKGPIVRVFGNNEHEDAKPNDPIIMDNEIAEQISKKYGTENYLDANKIEDESSSSYYHGETFYGLDGVIQNTHDKKMFCSEIEIDNSKSFCKDNKEKMQQQMNVVALYSIKDAKPFYYISSAEARMAIEYVSLCRRYHTDVTTRNNQFITEVVLNVDEIINSIKDSQSVFHRDDMPDALVWKRNCFDFDEEQQEEISNNISSNIEELYKRCYLAHRFNNFIVKLNKFNVKMDKRTITAATSIIEINRRFNGLHTYMHYIVGGGNAIKLLLNGKYQDPNLTERQLFGIVGNKTIGNGGGTYPVFINEKINPNSIIIISNRFIPEDTKNNIFIGEYIMDKIEVEKKDLNFS